MSISDRIDRMHVQASSPDGQVTAELIGRAEMRLSFADGYYRSVSERQMENTLVALGRLLLTARVREFRAVIADAGGRSRLDEDRSDDDRDRHFYQQQENIVAQGHSADGRFQLRVRGMKDWEVRISPGLLRDLTEDEFRKAVGAAAATLIFDQQAQVRELRMLTYAPEFVSDYPGNS